MSKTPDTRTAEAIRSIYDQEIEGVSLTEKHVGARVVYNPLTRAPHSGKISSWNDLYIFVKYDENPENSQATRPTDLTWEII